MNNKHQNSDDFYGRDTFIGYESINVNDAEQKELEGKQIDCCIAYIDILGFKDMIDHDSHLPVFALRFIKRFINLYYHTYNGYSKDINAEDELDDDNLPKATIFSDSIVISQPIMQLNYPFFIDLIAQLQYGLFSKGILIRGGISFGKLYHDENYLFGKGLIKAYLFESQYADYPRILVDADLIEEMHRIVDQRFEHSWNDYFLVNGKKYYFANDRGLENDEGDYSSYVVNDFDNQMYINYFSTIIEYGFMNFDANRSKYQLENLISEPEFANAKSIIEAGLKTKDHRILTKYEWLRKLYNSSMRHAFIMRKIDKDNKTLNKLLIR